MKKTVIFLISFIPLLIIAAGISFSHQSNQQLFKPYTNAKIEIKSFRNDCSPLFFLPSLSNRNNESWGYDIYMNGVLYVHQPYIPALAQNRGFKNEEDAIRTARLAADKIRNNISPFNISTHELSSLGIVK